MKFVVFAVTAAILSTSALAEPVSIRVGADKNGHGWIFKYGDQCVVATAGHVLESQSGRIVTAKGIVGEISSVRYHPSLDLAIATIEGRAKIECPLSDKGYSNSRPAIENAAADNRQLNIVSGPVCLSDVRGCSGKTVAQIKIDGLILDKSSFRFRRVDGSIGDTRRGDSGSIILDTSNDGVSSNTPIGILIETINEFDGSAKGSRQTSFAIPFSEVRAWLDGGALSASRPATLKPIAQAASASFRLIDVAADVSDAACGALNAVRGDGCGFVARPQRGARTVDLVVAPSVNRSMSSLEMTFDGTAPLPKGVEILRLEENYAGVNQSNWTSLRYCRISSVTLSCNIGEIDPSTLLIRFDGPTNLVSIRTR